MACSVFIPRTQSASLLVLTLSFRATTAVDSTPSFRRVASLFTVNLSHFHFYTFGAVFCCFTPSCLGVIVVCTEGFVFSLFGVANGLCLQHLNLSKTVFPSSAYTHSFTR
ncbi:uncharacterized protein G2W53_013889 [Senna tora]|uniref:Uncharacterized protein n=1 Tax=Senna tora TaxID=362788 RepID=A0A834U266_9FABA|nr:uncharacterized protein G2W53_013889 [Senna tora]